MQKSFNTNQGQILKIPENIRQDTLGYRDNAARFLKGETSAAAFRAYRVPMGIYEQRQAGKYMVRMRIPAGLVLPYQLERIADLSKTYGDGILHITTRQDIQIHKVDIEDTPAVLEGLLEAGLSPRGGGGNTVRNITACPRSGVCPKERFDVAPYAVATAEYLLQDRGSFNLPRKYKIAFSGCSEDCAFASVADLGFFAHVKNGARGFAVYAAGGLGPNPAVAVKIEDFIPENEIFEAAEAIKRLFDKYGDRTNKHKARLRYVPARLGVEKFIELYQKEKKTLKADGLPYEPPQIRDIASAPPAPESSVAVRVWLKNGDIPADDLAKVAHIAAKYGRGPVRTTQLQDLLILAVAAEDIDKVNGELKNLSINVFGDSGLKVVTCTGASTCKLGLCLSKGLADAVSGKLGKAGLSDTVIRISGCPNSCGHHYIADIGFQGKASRINGKLMPTYDVLVGAKIAEGDAHLAERIGTVPAKQIPDLLAEALSEGTIDKNKIRSLVAGFSEINEKAFLDDYYYDYGSDRLFSLAGRGPGECGAGVMDVIKLDIDEAKNAIKAAPVNSENIYKAAVAAARALLVTFGLEPKKDREIFAAFDKHLIEPGWVKPQTRQLLDDAIDWKMAEKESIENSHEQVRELIGRVEELFYSLDGNLKFRAEPAVQKMRNETDEAKEHIIDLRGVTCPLNFVKAKIELEKLDRGDVLEVLLDGGEPVQNVPASFTEQGQQVLEVKKNGDHYSVKVRRKK